MMCRDNEQEAADERTKARRVFMTKCGQFAAITGPAVTLILQFSSKAAVTGHRLPGGRGRMAIFLSAWLPRRRPDMPPLAIRGGAVLYRTSAAFRTLLVATDEAECSAARIVPGNPAGNAGNVYGTNRLMDLFATHGSRHEALAGPEAANL
jgi:hypothetical protein